MKKNSILIAALFLMMLPSFNLYSAVPCECGSQAGGSVTAYSVVDGQGCCTGALVASSVGFIHHYRPDEGSTYVYTGSTQITASAAQNSCCPPG